MATEGDREGRQTVGSVARALALIDALAGSDAGLGVNELARRIGVNASTASRLLATLEGGRIVERAPGGPYRLGLKLVELSDRVLSQLDVRELARPWLAWLVQQTGETATLSIPGEDEAVTVDFVPSSFSVVSMARVGRPSVPHATAAGKVMLAFGQARGAPGDERDHGAPRDGRDHGAPRDGRDRSAPLHAFTDRTITDPRALAEQLAEVRMVGTAEAVGEREPELNALAAPVLGRDGRLLAIIGLQGPAARLPAAKRKALRAPLREAARQTASALGAPDQLQG
jgi:DNA-binding IclR family transcriptional regulator